MRCDKCGVSAAEYELRKGLCLSCCATELERALAAWQAAQAVGDNLKAELERVKDENVDAAEAFELLAFNFPSIQVDCASPIEAVQRINQEFERVQAQVGVCEQCGCVAWGKVDATTDECQFCKLQRELERVQAQCTEMREAMGKFLRAKFGKFEGIPIDIDLQVEAYKYFCKEAMKGDAGRGWADPETVKLLVEALQLALDWHNRVEDSKHPGSTLFHALAIAREKGLA